MSKSEGSPGVRDWEDITVCRAGSGREGSIAAQNFIYSSGVLSKNKTSSTNSERNFWKGKRERLVMVESYKGREAGVRGLSNVGLFIYMNYITTGTRGGCESGMFCLLFCSLLFKKVGYLSESDLQIMGVVVTCIL